MMRRAVDDVARNKHELKEIRCAFIERKMVQCRRVSAQVRPIGPTAVGRARTWAVGGHGGGWHVAPRRVGSGCVLEQNSAARDGVLAAALRCAALRCAARCAWHCSSSSSSSSSSMCSCCNQNTSSRPAEQLPKGRRARVRRRARCADACACACRRCGGGCVGQQPGRLTAVSQRHRDNHSRFAFKSAN
jgi:hypothetical protein